MNSSIYNGLSAGLGAEFAAEIRGSLGRITEYPEAWQLLGPRVRRYRLKRFPYGLVYRLLQMEIINCCGDASSPQARLLERAGEADLSNVDPEQYH